MNKNKLMGIYDKAYDETFIQVLETTSDREEAKRVMGQIYTETHKKIGKSHTNVEQVKALFEQVKVRFGIVRTA